MLGERYKYDGRPVVDLTPVQQMVKRQIEDKLDSGRYKTEKVLCAVCGGSSFETLSQKDRFGLPLSAVICRDCGLVQTNPRLDGRSLEEFYHEEFIRMDLSRQKPGREQFVDQYFHGQKIFSYLKAIGILPPKGSFILEVGCSAGGILAFFRDKGYEVSGLDLDEESVRFGVREYRLDLRAGTLAGCSFEKDPDLIIMSHVLEHLSDPNSELSRVRSLLGEKALLYVEVPGIHNLFFNFYDLDFLGYLRITHNYCFSRTTLSNLLLKNGFEVQSIDNRISAICRKGGKNISFQNDYKTAMGYLCRLEVLKKFAFVTPFKIRRFIEGVVCGASKKIGLYGFARSVYRKIINRVEPGQDREQNSDDRQ